MNMFALLACLAVTFFVTGCGQDISRYREMRNIVEAPLALQNAAEAIVLVDAPSSSGTGFFVSSTGLLMTNNHVLGAAEENGHCARQGCYIKIRWNFQIGKPVTDAVTVFAAPKKVNVELDATVFQLWKEDRSEQLQTPRFLSLRAVSASDLIGRQVHVIGHPSTGLKKWTAGAVFRRLGTWFQSTNLGLPGDSGSPALDDSGNVVGIVHRGTRNFPYFVQRNDIMVYTLGTAGNELRRFLDAPDDNTPFFDLDQAVRSNETIVTFDDAYLMARRDTHRGAAAMTSNLETLEAACRESVQRPVTTPDQFAARVKGCSVALRRIRCLGDAARTDSCPEAGVKRDAWRETFGRAADLSERLNHDEHLFWRTRASMLETSNDDRNRVAYAALQDYIRRDSPPLDLSLASFLMYFGSSATETYRGRNLLQYFIDYRNVPGYEYDYDTIRDTMWDLLDDGVLTRSRVTQMLDVMFADPKLPLGDRLVIEANAYHRGFL